MGVSCGWKGINWRRWWDFGKGVGEGKQRGTWRDAGLSTKPRFRPGLHLLATQPVDMGAVYKVLFKYYWYLAFSSQAVPSASWGKTAPAFHLSFLLPLFTSLCSLPCPQPLHVTASSCHTLPQAEPRCCVVCEALWLLHIEAVVPFSVSILYSLILEAPVVMWCGPPSWWPAWVSFRGSGAD